MSWCARAPDIGRRSNGGRRPARSDAPARRDRHARSLCHIHRVRLARETRREWSAVQRRAVAFEPSLGGAPNPPGFVLDTVLDRAAIGLRGVSPVVFGDELLERSWGGA